jgi:hypothetical protein
MNDFIRREYEYSFARAGLRHVRGHGVGMNAVRRRTVKPREQRQHVRDRVDEGLRVIGIECIRVEAAHRGELANDRDERSFGRTRPIDQLIGGQLEHPDLSDLTERDSLDVTQ